MSTARDDNVFRTSEQEGGAKGSSSTGALGIGANAMRMALGPTMLVGALIYLLPCLIAIIGNQFTYVGSISIFSPVALFHHWVAIIPTLFIAVIQCIGLAMLSQLFLRRDRPLTERLRGFARRLPAIFVLTIVIAVGALALLVPGSYALFVALLTASPVFGIFALFLVVVPPLAIVARVSFVLYVCVDEKVGPGRAIRRSFSLTKGKFWRIVGLVVIFLVAGFFVEEVASAIVTSPDGLKLWNSYDDTQGLTAANVSTAIQMIIDCGIFLPWLWNALGAMYEDARKGEMQNTEHP